MTTGDILRRGVKQKLLRIIARFRASPGEMTRAVSFLETAIGRVGYIIDKPITNDAGQLFSWAKADLPAGAETINGSDVADAIERDLDATIEATARDIELAAEYFIDDKSARVRALAEPVLAEAFDISERTNGGRLLRRFMPFTASLKNLPLATGEATREATSLPADIDIVNVATWAQSGLRKLSTERTPEIVTGDDGKPTTKDMDLADRFVHLATQSAFLAQPSVAHPGDPALLWSISGVGLAWLYVAANTHRLVALDEIEKMRREGNALASADVAALELRKAIEEHLGSARNACGLPLTVEDLDAVGEEGGRYALDERLAVHIEGLQLENKDAAARVAKQIRENSGKQSNPATRWVDPRRACTVLAVALWGGKVAPRLEREKKKPAALARVVTVNVIDMLRPGQAYKDGYAIDVDGKQGTIFRRSEALNVPTVEMGALATLLKKGVGLLGSIQAHRVVRTLVTLGHRQVIAGNPDARNLRFVGGWSALAKEAGVSESEDARAIIVALAHGAFPVPGGGADDLANLLTYTPRPHAPGRPALLSVTLGDMLLPHYVHSITGKTRTASESRQLIPIVDFAGFVGRRNDHAAQAALQMRVILHMRTHAVELAKTGMVRITAAAMAEMAEAAEVSPALLPKVLDRWVRDGDDAPAFLVRDGDQYTLAETHTAALALMVEAGNESLRSSRAGVLSANRKHGPRKRRSSSAS